MSTLVTPPQSPSRSSSADNAGASLTAPAVPQSPDTVSSHPHSAPNSSSNSTPIRKKILSGGVGRPTITRSDFYTRRAVDAEGLGTMVTPEVFFAKCLDNLSPGPEQLPQLQFNTDGDGKISEADFVQCVSQSGLMAKRPIIDTHSTYDHVGEEDRRSSPDFGILNTNQGVQDIQDEGKYYRHLAVFGDVKGSSGQDPFTFMELMTRSLTHHRQDNIEATKARGQFLWYANQVMAAGHRTACFAFLILPGTKARLMRFDNSGIIFTTLFDYVSDPHLTRFLWIVNCAPPHLLGYDCSVKPLLPASPLVIRAQEILKAKAADVLPAQVTAKHFFPDSNDRYFLFCVVDDVSGMVHRVVAALPYVESSNFIGRATRGYLGVDLDSDEPDGQRLVFMKDSWRISLRGMHSESETYRHLALRGVSEAHLPGFYLGGDLPTSLPDIDVSSPDRVELKLDGVVETQTALAYNLVASGDHLRAVSDRREQPIEKMEMYPHTHHRQLFKKIGARLDTFQSTLQLCTVLYHAVLCHEEALGKAEVLHRDISGGNVMIDRDGVGFLSDWDLCRWFKDGDPRRKGRTGTWQFMSIDLGRALLGHVQSRRDDLESVLHILFYYVLRYTPLPNWNRKKLELEFSGAFEESTNDEGQHKIVEGRLSYIRGTRFTAGELRACVQPRQLATLMVTLRSVFIPIYAVPSYEDPEIEAARFAEESMSVGSFEAPPDEVAAHAQRKSARIAELNASSKLVKDLFETWVISRSQLWPTDDAAQDWIPRIDSPAVTNNEKRKSSPNTESRQFAGTGGKRSRTSPYISSNLSLSSYPEQLQEEGVE